VVAGIASGRCVGERLRTRRSLYNKRRREIVDVIRLWSVDGTAGVLEPRVRQRQPTTTTRASQQAPSSGRSSTGERRLAAGLRIAVHHLISRLLLLLLLLAWRRAVCAATHALHGSRRQLMLTLPGGISPWIRLHLPLLAVSLPLAETVLLHPRTHILSLIVSITANYRYVPSATVSK